MQDRCAPPKIGVTYFPAFLHSSLPPPSAFFPGLVLVCRPLSEVLRCPISGLSPTAFVSRDSHVVPGPKPRKYRLGQAQSTFKWRRTGIRAQLVPWSTVPFDPTAGLRRSEPGNFDPRLSAGRCKSDFGCGWAHSERHGTNDRRGWNVCQLQWGEAEEYPGGLLSDGGLCSGVAKI